MSESMRAVADAAFAMREAATNPKRMGCWQDEAKALDIALLAAGYPVDMSFWTKQEAHNEKMRALLEALKAACDEADECAV